MKERASIPIYQSIRMQIHKDISSGRLPVGEMIPSEQLLAKKYQVSVTTIRKAIESLTKEGIIERKRGLGSFVRKNLRETKMSLKGSFNDILAIAHNTSSQIIKFEYVSPGKQIVERLNLPSGSQTLNLERIRFKEGAPFLYSISYIPDEIAQYFTKKELEEYTLTQLIMKKCDIPVVRAVQNFSATIATIEMAQILEVPVGFPLLEIERIGMTEDNRPVNLFYGYFRSDVYKFTTEFVF